MYDRTCCPKWEGSYEKENQGIGLIPIEEVKPDNAGEEGEEDNEGEEVPKHDPAPEGEGLDDQVVEKDCNESSEDVDQSNVKDNCAVWKLFLKEIHCSHKTVVGQQKPNPREE